MTSGQNPERIVGDRLRVESGTKGQRAVLREQNRVTVFSRLHAAVGADRAPPAPGRLIESTGVFSSLEISSPKARTAMSAASPGGKRNHEIDRAGGERLSLGDGRQPDERASEKNALCDPFHGQSLPKGNSEFPADFAVVRRENVDPGLQRRRCVADWLVTGRLVTFPSSGPCRSSLTALGQSVRRPLL